MTLLLFVSFLSFSCVNEEYDMSDENLNLEVTPFEDGLTIPLGSTEKITLKELLKDVDPEILGSDQTGAYRFSFGDSFDMSDRLSSLKNLVEIPDVDFSKQITFRLEDADVSDVKIEEMDYTFSQELSVPLEDMDMTLPSVSESIEVEAGMTDYVLDQSKIDMNLEPVEYQDHLLSISDDFHVPSHLVNDDPLPIDRKLLSAFVHFTPEMDYHEIIPLKISLPEGISSVDEVHMRNGAGIKVTMAVEGNLIESGVMVPDINVDIHNLFHINGSMDDIAHLGDDFELSEKNGFRQSVIYGISSLAVSPDDWKWSEAEGAVVLDKSFEVAVNGEIVFRDLVTTTRHIENDRDIDLVFRMEFVDMFVEDILMELDPIEMSHRSTVPFAVDDVELPSEIKSFSDVTFTPESGFDIAVRALNLDRIEGLEAELETLTLVFPEEIKVEGADARNSVSVNDVDLAEGRRVHFHIKSMELPEPTEGKLSYNGEVAVEAVLKASGKVHSSDLPAVPEEDVRLSVEVDTFMEIADYKVTFSGYEYEINAEPEHIEVEVPEELASLEEIVIYPEGNPAVTIDFDFPETALDIVPSAEGLKLRFPEMVRFGSLPQSYNHDRSSNSITFYESIPSEIILPIDRLVLVPVRNPSDGKLYAQGDVELSGGIALKPGTISKADVDALIASVNEVSVTAHIPELVPSVVSVGSMETGIHTEIDVELISPDDIPEELVAVGLVELEDTYLNLSLDASGLPELGETGLSMDLSVTLPDIINAEGADENGTLRLAGRMDDKCILKIDPVKIVSLNLEGVDIRKGVSCVLPVDGTVRLEDASLDVDEWIGKDLMVTANVAVNDIGISSVSGQIDYDVDPVTEIVDLSEIADVLDDAGVEMNLDFNHAHLVLEVTSNLGIPAEVTAEIVPYFDGKADEAAAVPITLYLHPAESADKPKTEKFWLADDSQRCPSGYTFVKAGILELLDNLPQMLEIRLNAGTDPECVSVLEPSADYILKADYLFELPLEFGEEFEVTFRTTVSDMPEIVGYILSKGNKVKLAGEIANSLPLGLELRLNFLDSDGNAVPLAEGCGVQTIAPCNLDASASETPLEMLVALDRNAPFNGVESLELVFNADAKDVAGIPVTEDAYLQAVLQLVLPEGITLDIDEIINDK